MKNYVSSLFKNMERKFRIYSMLYLIKYIFVIKKQKNCTIQGIFISASLLG